MPEISNPRHLAQLIRNTPCSDFTREGRTGYAVKLVRLSEAESELIAQALEFYDEAKANTLRRERD